ncbi:MAG: SPOR domain-containing protein [Woeseiaceae bacterium]|nr:SPOR domain-containing protein [Woeseiaceae bacterium]
MDRALKERIVGATVLVVFIVLVVPVFLDGPSGGIEVVSEPVALPGQEGQPSKRQTIVLERDRTEPVPVSGATNADESAEPPQDTASPDDAPAVEAPAPEDVPGPPAAVAADSDDSDELPAESPAEPDAGAAESTPPPADAPATESTTGMWAVQLGSFAQQDNAERLAASLREAGYAAFLSRLQGANGLLHRVRIGPQKDRASAEAMASRLAGDGHKGQVVPHP